MIRENISAAFTIMGWAVGYVLVCSIAGLAMVGALALIFSVVKIFI